MLRANPHFIGIFLAFSNDTSLLLVQHDVSKPKIKRKANIFNSLGFNGIQYDFKGNEKNYKS